ncbi:unnamed protein product [Symbiodinium sp. CCMP2456]|nr:unnamed protein product [Symbiodinium sp. CCMP2456]
MASPPTSAGAVLPARALLIKPQWLEPIFSGRQTWEVRVRDLRIRGRVCLASEGKLVGEVEFTDCFPIGARDAGNTLVSVPGYDHNFMGLQANKDKRCIEDVTVLTYTRLFAWVTKDAFRCVAAIPYSHPLGAQQFVDLTRPGVVSATAALRQCLKDVVTLSVPLSIFLSRPAHREVWFPKDGAHPETPRPQDNCFVVERIVRMTMSAALRAGKKGKLWKGAGPAAKKSWVRKVPWSDRLSKYFLRPYVDAAGSPFAGTADEKDLLTSWHLQGVLDQTCSEYCARQGVALSEGAANLEVGAALLAHHISIDPEEACKYLNTANEDLERNDEATSTAVKRFLRFFTTDAGKKEAYFKKLARFSARLYLFAFEGLEAITALNNPKVMAAGVHHIGADYNLPGPSNTWLKKLTDQEAMLGSFAAAFQKIEGVKKRSGAVAFDDWDETTTGDVWDAGQKGGYAWGHDEDEDEEEMQKPSPPPKKRHPAASLKPAAAHDALASDDEPFQQLDLESSPEALLAKAKEDTRDRPPLQDALTDNLRKLLHALETMVASLDEALQTQAASPDKRGFYL